MKPLRVLVLLLSSLAALAAPSLAQTPDNVLVVVNGRSTASQEIGAHYMKVRAIPASNMVRVEVPETDVIARGDYQALIEQPIGRWILKQGAQDRILYIVLTKGIPLRIDGTTGQAGAVASVDSELTLLYRRLTGATVAPQGKIANPYFLSGGVKDAKRFTHETQDIYLVTRLDAFTVPDVIALIDRGANPSTEGKFVLDQKAALGTTPGETWLEEAAAALREQGLADRTVLETTTLPFQEKDPLLGYYSWGSNDPALRERKLDITFSPGAIGALFVSSDARTFREPPAGWKPSAWQRREMLYANSPETLTGDLIRSGLTGVSGNVAEPYTEAAVRPQVLFPAYAAGFNLAESFYLATPFLSWQTVVIGDPLCAPFGRTRTDTIVPGSIDPATELPAFFSERRFKVLSTDSTFAPEAIRLFMRGEARWSREDTAGARQALEEATKIEPKFTFAQLTLASVYEKAEEYDLAIERYRAMLEVEPNNSVALNNLAYGLAVRKNQPQEALPLAKKAYTQMRAVASGDTYGWILHLTGDDNAAAGIFTQILRAPIKDPDILLHAATVFAAVGRLDVAGQLLTTAAKLDPAFEAREEVKELKKKIGKGSK